MPRWYIRQPGGTVHQADSFEELRAAQAFDMDSRRVAYTEIAEEVYVSTVFLNLDHSHSPLSPPILFETLVFGGPMDGEMKRYVSEAEALQAHQRIVSEVRAGLGLEDM